jgi:hypothetical protein
MRESATTAYKATVPPRECPNKVDGADPQLLDERNEVGDMLTEAELTGTAPWLRIVVP